MSSRHMSLLPRAALRSGSEQGLSLLLPKYILTILYLQNSPIFLYFERRKKYVSFKLIFTYTQDVFTCSLLVSANLRVEMGNRSSLDGSLEWGHRMGDNLFLGVLVAYQLYSLSSLLHRVATGNLQLVGFSPEVFPYPCEGGNGWHGTAFTDGILTLI